MTSDNQYNDQNVKQKPDAATEERIRNLAAVGKALHDTYSDENQEVGTDFFLAKDYLNRFRSGIEKLDLDLEAHDGMIALIEYLQKEIDKRLSKQGDVAF